MKGQATTGGYTTTKEVFKHLKAAEVEKTKRILNKEFDIGKSIVIQGASLKAKVADTIDTAIDKSDNKKCKDWCNSTIAWFRII